MAMATRRAASVTSAMRLRVLAAVEIGRAFSGKHRKSHRVHHPGMRQTGAGGDWSKSKIRHEALPPDDPKLRRPDITKARTLLGWEPKIDLETGLRLSLDYFRKAQSARYNCNLTARSLGID